jgi:hypothetical protein
MIQILLLKVEGISNYISSFECILPLNDQPSPLEYISTGRGALNPKPLLKMISPCSLQLEAYNRYLE